MRSAISQQVRCSLWFVRDRPRSMHRFQPFFTGHLGELSFTRKCQRGLDGLEQTTVSPVLTGIAVLSHSVTLAPFARPVARRSRWKRSCRNLRLSATSTVVLPLVNRPDPNPPMNYRFPFLSKSFGNSADFSRASDFCTQTRTAKASTASARRRDDQAGWQTIWSPPMVPIR